METNRWGWSNTREGCFIRACSFFSNMFGFFGLWTSTSIWRRYWVLLLGNSCWFYSHSQTQDWKLFGRHQGPSQQRTEGVQKSSQGFVLLQWPKQRKQQHLQDKSLWHYLKLVGALDEGRSLHWLPPPLQSPPVKSLISSRCCFRFLLPPSIYFVSHELERGLPNWHDLWRVETSRSPPILIWLGKHGKNSGLQGPQFKDIETLPHHISQLPPLQQTMPFKPIWSHSRAALAKKSSCWWVVRSWVEYSCCAEIQTPEDKALASSAQGGPIGGGALERHWSLDQKNMGTTVSA